MSMSDRNGRTVVRDPVPLEDGFPPSRAAWLALWLLLAAYTCSFIDRQILSLLVEPIKRDFGLTDPQIGLLQGLSFGLFYSLLGIPFGMLADRRNRRNLIVLAIVGWSVATALCGLAESYGQLFLARMAVGVGEACLAPAAYSLISDSFPPHKRGRAISVYASGAYCGIGLAFAAGAAAVAYAAEARELFLQIGFERSDWQSAFLMVSLLGLVIAPLLLFIREPVRQERRETGGAGFIACLTFLRARLRFYLPFVAALCCIGIVNFSFFSWTAVIFQRSFGWAAEEIGVTFGIILALLGPAGGILGGLWVDRSSARRSDQTAVRLTMRAVLMASPFALLVGFSGSEALAILGLVGIVALLSIPSAMGPFIVQTTTPNQFRGTAIALYFLIVNLVGLGVGPYLAAMISEWFFEGPESIGKAVALLGGVVLPTSAALFYLSLRVLRENRQGGHALA